TALEDTQTLIAELEGRSETIASALDELEPRLAAASAEAAAALEALHSSDAKIMAAAEEVSRITGEIASSRSRLRRVQDNAPQPQWRLQAAEREAEPAPAAPEGAAEVDEVVDTSDRPALSAEVSQSSEALGEARISHKSATDRAR